ncbi:hypothetical protein [Stutzerimonas nitrititolerans]|uniref:hypothetical protein n=1 Tax=Stutzerimonas nitrititolerans TaxID=2482751 RepID=UPI00289B115B|nr:hypothetical protein [Stutzerimonas nitrititolerans]
MTKHPLLRKYLLEHFAAEVEELKDAVFVGLGPQVHKVLDRLIQERVNRPSISHLAIETWNHTRQSCSMNLEPQLS